MGIRDKIAKAVMGIKAYHSSPHDFDRFDLSKIGTGEGAQVYGHGIYAAENPAVSGQGGQYWQQFQKKFEGPEYLASHKLKQSGFDRDAAAALAQKDIDALNEALKSGAVPPGLADPVTDPHILRSITKNMLYDREAELALLRSNRPVGPRTYELNIRADPAQMLDWDKPLREQPIAGQIPSRWLDEARKEAQSRAYGSTTKARSDQLWDMVKDPLNAPGEFLINSRKYYEAPEISKSLNEAGIPGIKYLDEGSRNLASNIAQAKSIIAQGGVRGRGAASVDAWTKQLDEWRQQPQTSNYVIFDPANIDIVKKYGVAGAPAAGGMGSLFDQGQYEEMPR